MKLRGLNRTDSTIKTYLTTIKQFVTFCGNKNLKEINTLDFDNFTTTLLKRKVKSGTLKTVKFGVNFGFNEILNNNIDLSSMPTPSTPRLKKEYFEKKELLKFFSVIDNLKHRAILELMYSAGLDTYDLINIKITDIQSDKKLIHIRNSKNEILRNAYLSPTILITLRQYFNTFKPKTYLFEGQRQGKTISERNIQTTFKNALTKSGVNKNISLRSLKISHIKHLVEDGISINNILHNLKIDNSDTIKNYMELCYPIKKYNSSPLDTLKIEYDDFDFFDTTTLEYLLTKVKDEQERDYLLEGIKCFKANALRAGVIFLWSAAIFKIQKKCIDVNLGYVNVELKKIYSKAKDIKVIEDFEYIKDEFLLDLACNIKVLDKTIKEELKNTCLDLRNKCSHPGSYRPKGQKIKAYVEDIIGMLYE